MRLPFESFRVFWLVTLALFPVVVFWVFTTGVLMP